MSAAGGRRKFGGKPGYTMENLLFSLNATMPIFFMMVLGMVFKRIGWIDDAFVDSMNQFVFKAALPLTLFESLAGADFFQVWDTRFVLFCFFATLGDVLIAAGCALFLKDKALKGEFIQASYRSSASIMGIAFMKNIYGNAGLGPLMIIGSVPLYNIMAVLVLSVTRPGGGAVEGDLMKKTVKSIATNPIILGVAAGMVWSLLKLPQPPIMQKTVSSLGNVATPMGLVAMGAAFDFKKVGSAFKPAMGASFLKLVGCCAIFLPIAVMMGFRREALAAILVMLGSATTVSCYVMAHNMGHEGTLTTSVVALTTCVSAFTLTFWLYLIKSMGLI